MNKNTCRQHRARPGHLLRQTLAAALAFSLFAGLATPAFADNAVAPTAHKPSNAENEMPKITLQINGVIDEQTKKFTEYVEVAVLVESGVKYYDSTHAEISKATYDANAALSTPLAGYTAEVQAFRYLSLALEYNADVLTPVAWGDPTTGVNAPTPALSDPYTASFKNQVIFPTLKGKANTTAIAHVSGPDATAVVGNTDHDSGLFYLMAEADKPVELTTPTALAVVRFKYTPSTDAASYLSDPAHMLLTDSAPWAALNKSSEVMSGTYREIDVTAWQTAADENWLVRFAPDAVAGTPATAAPDAVQLLYRSSSNAFYYMTEVNSSTGAITPGAKCVPLYAEDDTADPQSPLYQLLDFGSDGKKNVQMVYTNRPTFDSSGGLDYSKLTACVIVDADNTILGTVIVPKNADVRQQINDYVRDNFVYEHTDGTTDSLRTLTSAQVKSLDRVDTYRGKYPATTPMADGKTEADLTATEATNLGLSHPVASTVIKDSNGKYIGESYPLTNKLDYVFFKRPMERVATGKPDVTDTTAYPGGESNATYQADYANWLATAGWTQKKGATATTPLYDDEYPFAYGWALCTQDNYQDTWTWLGSNGELSNYAKDGDGFASVTYQNGAAGVTFAFADLENGFTTGQDTVFLKAVYEPGTSNLGSSNYRIITTPYFAKVNNDAAAGGGNFSASFTMERSAINAGVVRGVAIIREPVVRQSFTYDMFWEENEDIGLKHNAPPALMDEYLAYSKSSYIEVVPDNAEQIAISMTLSARMNKINWELADKWGANFVSATPRSNANDTMITDATDKGNWVPDNYNYYVDGESSDTDDWYDAPYKYREGSYGFVLFGTLNSIMEKATIHNHDTSETSFSAYVTIDTLNDINISTDGNPIAPATLNTVRQKILAAAQAAEDEYKNNGKTDWWDVEHNCAKMTYHQLQDYILNSNLRPLDSHEADTVTGLTWCHLHAACASNLANVPTDWDGLLSVARSADPSALGTMKTAEIEQYFHLRADADGTALTPAQFQTKVVQAVTNMDAATGNATTRWSWDQVQDYIIRGAGYDSTGEYSRNNYWWYDGLGKVTDWDSMMTAVGVAVNGPGAPLADGSGATTPRLSKLNTAEDPTLIPAILKGLAKSGTHGGPSPTEDYISVVPYEYADFSDLVTDLTTKVWPNLPGGVTVPDWDQAQYLILNNSNGGLSAADLTTFGHNHYWWYDGGELPTDITTLIAADAANQGADPRPAALNQLTDAQASGNPFYFRKAFDGTAFGTGEFKTKVDGISQAYDASSNIINDWMGAQYYLIHGSYSMVDAVAEYSYYWWEAGNNMATGPPIVAGNIDTFVNAAFASKHNGNTNAWDNLTLAKITAAYLYKPADEATAKNTYDDRAAIPKYDGTTNTLASFTSAMEALVDAAMSDTSYTGHGHTPPTLTWYQIQKYLTDGLFVADGVVDRDVYWWLTDEDNPNKPLTHDNWDTLMGKVLAYYNSGTNSSTRSTSGNLGTGFNTTLLGKDDVQIKRTAAGAAFSALNYTTARTRLTQMINNAANNLNSANDVKALTWWQVQSAIISSDGTIDFTATASTYSWAPKWVKKAGSDGLATYSTSAVGTPAPLMLNASAPVALMMVEPATATSEDGLTTAVTDSDYVVDEETGSWTLTQTVTSTTRTDSFEVVTTTITTTTFDPETGLTDTVTEVTNSVLTYETNAEESPAPSGDAVTPVDPTPADTGDYAIEPDAVIVIGTDDPVEEPTEPAVEEPAEEPTEEPVEELTEEPTEETAPEPEEEPTEPTDADPPDDTGPTEMPAPTDADTTESTEEEGETMTIAPETSATARLSYWSPPDPGGTYMVVYGPPAYTINRWEVIA